MSDRIVGKLRESRAEQHGSLTRCGLQRVQARCSGASGVFFGDPRLVFLSAVGTRNSAWTDNMGAHWKQCAESADTADITSDVTSDGPMLCSFFTRLHHHKSNMT